ncbi:MAG: sulfite exporter TauE/SafE family protein [Motiliproteus sp.]|nr:sulfite exporter TauE/SafE family protein [Motiliproteus sp.]MCW9053581.1 sulfite exporter TauE/SafE family protein [Motiliproteus sp.]
MDLIEQSLLLIISFVANSLSALAGGGAGLLQFPVLLFLGLSFGTALATHKTASVALGVGATIRHLREGGLDWRFAGYILAWGLPGVVLGAYLILSLNESLAVLSLGILTTGLGLYSRFKKDLGMELQPIHRDTMGMLLGGVGLFLIGMLNGSLTSGTGLFVTIWLVRWFGLDYQRAVTYTLILVGMFWNGFGAVTVSLQTDPRWEWLPVLLLGSLLGAYCGTHLGLSKGNKVIKKAFEVLTLLVGIKLIWDGITLLT